MNQIPPDDALWREAQPLVIEALDGFDDFEGLVFRTSTRSVSVSSLSSKVLQEAVDRMRPVFEGAGWEFRAVIDLGVMQRAAFFSPHAVARSKFHVVR